MWSFIQDEILGMHWLNRLIGRIVEAFGFDSAGRVGSSIQFFFYDVIKIFTLLGILIFVISYIQSYFPPERTKKIPGRFHGIGANIVAALLGKGALLGVVLSFMMGVTTLSLPSMIMLRKAVKPKLLGIFVAICTAGIILVGYLFNLIQPLIL